VIRWRRAAWGLVATLGLALAGCSEEPLVTAEASNFEGPPVADVLYPEAKTPLLEHAGFGYLPPTVPWVVVVDVPAALTASTVAAAFTKGGEPYDQVVEAASVHAVGVAMKTVGELNDAGLDVASAWGISRLKHADIVFGRVSDREKFVAALKHAVEEAGDKYTDEEVGKGRYIVTNRETRHAVWLIDDLAFMLRGASSKIVAEELAKVATSESLARHPEFSKSVAGVAFGAHAAAWYSLSGASESLKADYLVEGLEKRYADLEAWLDKQEGTDDDGKVAEVRGRLAHKDAEIAFAKARAERLGSLPPLLGVAMGLEVGPTTVRGKAFLPLADELKKKLFGPAVLMATAEPGKANAPKAVEHFNLPLSPEAALEVATVTVGTTHMRALRRWLAGADKAPKLSSWLTGATVRSRFDVDNRRHWRLELGVLPDAVKALRARLDATTIESSESLVIERDGDRIHLDQKRKYGGVERWLRIHDTSVVIASHESLVDVRPDALHDDDPPHVAALGDLPPSDGFLSLATVKGVLNNAHFARQASLRDAAEFGMIGLLNAGSSFGIGSFGSGSSTRRSLGEMTESQKEREKARKKQERKRKKLEKQRAKLRAEVATLKRRQRIESSSGRTRTLTALGTTAARVHPSADGVTFYFAQRIAEIDMHALGEHALYALVDSSSQSETAKRIRKLDKRIEKLDKALATLGPSLMMMDVMGTSAFEGSVLSSGFESSLGGIGGLGTAGYGPGGGGSAVGIGSLGTAGRGSGTKPGAGGSGRVDIGGGRGPD
jgi:hypothetical protein